MSDPVANFLLLTLSGFLHFAPKAEKGPSEPIVRLPLDTLLSVLVGFLMIGICQLDFVPLHFVLGLFTGGTLGFVLRSKNEQV